jgi:ribosomal small subunit protein bTHX
MGRGDKKTRKGKIFRGSSGNTRLKVKHPTNPLSQPDPSKIGVKTDAIKKLADAKPAPSEKKQAPAQDKKPVEKKAADKKPADKKPAKKE